jgi:putative PIN family toxin of toxin-antitoxin system
LKVVFDTNIYVSALILPGSRADSALMRIAEGTDRLIISKAIVDELLDVLSRKFAKDANELARVAVFLAELAEVVRPRGRIGVLQDEADNRILECARTGGAHVIVTGDKAMLRLRQFGQIRIISLQQYLEGNRSA